MSVFISIFISLFSALAFFYRKLTLAGALFAWMIGIVIYASFSFGGLVLLGLFFFSANLISSLKKGRRGGEGDIVEKGDCRDALQVIANGGVPAILAFFYLISPSAAILCGFVTSIAAVTADTWASEIGTFTKQRPRHLITLKRVPAGTSGAVTALGTSAAVVGSFLIVGIAIFFWGNNYYNSHLLLLLLMIAGFVGNLVDTFIGALFQVKYRCLRCGVQTERTIHCSHETVKVHGISWINNDVVNVACSLTGALLGISAGFVYF